MGVFGELMQKTLDLMKTPLTLYGFTFSFFEVFIFTSIAGCIGFLLYYFFLDD